MSSIGIRLGIIGATILLVALPASAHEHATGIVKERMVAMENVAKAMKEIRRRIEGKGDLAGIVPYAARIGAMAKMLTQLFPSGSSTPPSEALPTIWQRWPAFQAEAVRLDQESGKLGQAAASGDAKSLALQYRVVSEVCSDCHREFRSKK
jgi:cytochrome c556